MPGRRLMVVVALILAPSKALADQPDAPAATSKAQADEQAPAATPRPQVDEPGSPVATPKPRADEPGPPVVTSKVQSDEPGSPTTSLLPEVHAFVSQGFILTTGNNYLVRSKDGSFELSEVGINFTESVTDKLKVGIQLFAHKPATGGSYNVKADWFYLDYRWTDWLGIRAGRTKLPFGLYNEINDIDSARVPILLPQSVYPFQNRDYLLAQTGLELYGRPDLGSGGALDYRLYGGTIFLDVVNQPGSPYQLVELRTPYLIGGRLLWETPLEGFRVGGSLQALQLDAKLLAGTTPFDVEIPVVLTVGSIEYAFNEFLLAAEYSRWYLKAHSTRPDLFPETSQTISERGYAMAAYRLTSWFQPGVYYSLLFPDVEHKNLRSDLQRDVAATLRFDVNDHWLFKLEGHYMEGTAALTPGLNDNVPLSQLERTWVVFLAKTTAYF